MDKYLNILKNNIIFENIEEEDILRFFKCCKYKVQNIKANEMIHGNYNRRCLYIVLEGKVSVSIEDIAGDVKEISKLKPNDISGEVLSFANKKLIYSYVYIAEKDSVLLTINSEIFLNKCAEDCHMHKSIIINMFKACANKVLLFHKRVDFLTTLSVKKRVIKYLLDMHQEKKSLCFKLNDNREDIARYLNISRPTFSNELSKLQKLNLIIVKAKEITIINKQELFDVLYEEKPWD